jgi:hypothetical protein
LSAISFNSIFSNATRLPPLDIYRNLGGIGKEAAAKALMWLWGCNWNADIAGAPGISAAAGAFVGGPVEA